MEMKVSDIAALVGGAIAGDPSLPITGLNGLKEAQPGDLCFLRSIKYADLLAESRATAVLVKEIVDNCAATMIVVNDPDFAFAQVMMHYQQQQTHHPKGIHPTAVIGEHVTLGANVAIDAHVRIADHARIGDNCILYAGVYIGHHCTIGPDTLIYPNVTIREECQVGARCILHSNSCIGSDGFGYAPMGGQWMKIPQVGCVILEDDVEIGSNTSVDRATFGETRIGQGTKIDNLVQIGHNVQIGKHSAIAGSVGIAGSAVIGNRVRVGAQSGVAGHLTVGDDVTIAGRGGVTKSVEPGKFVSGFPARDHQEERRIKVSLPRVPELLRRVRQLERELEALKEG
ncbi:MAG: UDP-3-O-(3-hydroxymyristoyl)glucosamine N-acyltransferase [Candidatus Hydrogenedentes bacterium]|nr:UDP-3-O-(3-hydroxymyristoyl)glucosamine N-acyltransferase [Candidatus Hydrogenedentota bacterium]